MTNYIAIQIKVCDDAINRMQLARQQKDKDAFYMQKRILTDALSAIEDCDTKTFNKYSIYLDEEW